MPMRKVEKRKETKFFYEFSNGEEIVNMCTCQAKVFVATKKSVYLIKEDKIVPLKIKCEVKNANEKS